MIFVFLSFVAGVVAGINKEKIVVKAKELFAKAKAKVNS